jgi:NADH-ubiquinone oxidoreductase chain 6
MQQTVLLCSIESNITINKLIMFQLFLIEEYFTNGYFYQILNILSVLAIITGVLTILSKNPIVSILFLIALFASISSYLIIVGLSFIGLSYLIVYIGAVSILFLFILMLINVRTSELQSNTTNSTVLAILVAILSNYALQPSLPYNIANYNYNTIFALNNMHNASFSFSPKLNNSALPINIDNPDIYFVTSKS